MVRDTGMYLHRGCRMHFTSIERFIMCTGIEIISNQGKPYWGRTQDFEQHFEYAGMKIPAGTKIESTYTIAFQMLVSASSPASVGFDYMLMPRTRARCG